MRIVPASDSALFISFGDGISLEIHRRVIGLFRAIERLQESRIRNLHPAYASLLIDFDPLLLTHEELTTIVAPLISETISAGSEAAAHIEVPVCYEGEFAPDLQNVARYLSLSEEQVIAAHAAGDYFVYFLGFTPGFAYLGGLASELHVPRLATPRKHVMAGSVGLAGEQTGIYPSASPGGWQLIARTPLRMFDASIDPPSRLQPGDRVRFRRIDRREFDGLARQQGTADDTRY
jgi:KipI family sensor histidine kinase inhibitor